VLFPDSVNGSAKESELRLPYEIVRVPMTKVFFMCQDPALVTNLRCRYLNYLLPFPRNSVFYPSHVPPNTIKMPEQQKGEPIAFQPSTELTMSVENVGKQDNLHKTEGKEEQGGNWRIRRCNLGCVIWSCSGGCYGHCCGRKWNSDNWC
jgi:hypothetical protein